jgi:aromatic ring-opening dioxygenase LigB subunit
MLVFACISPHPPILLPDVGSSEDREKVKNTLTALETLHQQLVESKADLIIISSPHPDWGFNVPLHFLSPNSDIETHQELTSNDSPRQYFEQGQILIKKYNPETRIAWIASGDLSHKLKESGPYGFNPAGPKFDRELINLLQKGDPDGILDIDPKLAENAAVCGLQSISMMLGALDGTKWKADILSYEGPFGVGYLVARLV